MKTLKSNILLTMALLLFCNVKVYSKLIHKEAVQSIEIVYDSNQVIIPGKPVKIGIVAKIRGKKDKKTIGYAGGGVGWRHFNFDCSGCNISQGVLYIPYNELIINKGEVKISVEIKKKSEIKTNKIIKLNYETSVNIYAENNFYKVPGEKLDLQIVSTFNNGKKLKASASGYGSLNFKHYEIYAYGGVVKNGTFYIFSDLFDIENHQVGITAIPKSNRNIESNYNITLDYKMPYRYFTRAENGLDGWSGCEGSNGEIGERGYDGEDAQHGFHGKPGPELDIYVDTYFDEIVNENLLKIIVKNIDNGETRFYLVNTHGGEIIFTSRGGDGGNGGYGGNGGVGGVGFPGKIIEKKKRINDTTVIVTKKVFAGNNGGNGGHGGYGGHGGDGGDEGIFNVFYTKEAEPFLIFVHTKGSGGEPGMGGKGGKGGIAGIGGVGNPNGEKGLNGLPGVSGQHGFLGQPGFTEFFLVDEIPW